MRLATARGDGLRSAALVAGLAATGAIIWMLAVYGGYPVLAPAGLAFAIFCVIIYQQPVVGVAAGLLLVAAEAFPLPFPISPSEATMAAVGVCWIAHAITQPGSVALPAPRDLSILALLLSTAVGLALAEVKGPIVEVTALWTLFYLVYLQCQTLSDREIRVVLVAFATGAGLVGAVGLMTYLQSGPPQLYDGGLNTGARAAGAFGDANYSASILVLAAIPAIALVVLDPRRLWWLIPVLAVDVAAVLLSLSRGGFLALAAGIAVLALWGRFRVAGGVVLLLVFTVGLFNAEPITRSAQFSTVRERLGTLTGSELGATNLRPRIWAAAIDAGLEAPVFGVGAHNFAQAAAKRGVVERGEPLENVHNIPLNFFAENGFVGLLGFMIFFGQLLARASLASVRAGPLPRALGLGMLAALFGFLVQGATLMPLRVNAIVAAFFVLAGMITALADRARHDAPATRPERVGARG